MPHSHGPSAEDACTEALDRVQAFLHGELADDQADLIRLHLDACDKCLETYDVEQAITALIRRCNPPTCASSELRMRIVSMSMTLRRED